MKAEDFKKSYMKWSHAVAYCIPTVLMAIVLCDYLLEFDFSQNLYMMAFIATGFMLSLLSLTWITILNSKLFRDLNSGGTASGVVPEDDRKDGQGIAKEGE